MKKIAIIGAGGFGREVKMLIDQINAVEEKYDTVCNPLSINLHNFKIEKLE